MMNPIPALRVALAMALLSVSCSLAAQCPYEWSSEFQVNGLAHEIVPAPNAMFDVADSLTFDDGSGTELYVVGRFSVAGGERGSGVARWNGLRWQMLLSPIQPTAFIRAIVVYQGQLYIGGNFTSLDGLPANHVARWTGSGWVGVAGYNGGANVSSMAVYDHGTGPRLYVGCGQSGFFGTSSAPNSLTCFDGTSWNLIVTGSSCVLTLEVADFGSGPRLFIGGQFAIGFGSQCIYSWDGTTFTPLGVGLDGWVTKLLAVALPGLNPYLVVIGSFDTAVLVGPSGLGGMALWNGTTWAPMPNKPAWLVNPRSLAFETIAGQQLLYVGFAGAAGSIASFDGANWSQLGSGVANSPPGGSSPVNPSPSVTAIRGYDEGQGQRLFLFGNFTKAGARLATNAARWDGNDFSPLGGQATNDIVYALRRRNDGSGLYVGGAFTGAGDVEASRIAQWNGTNWSALGAGVNGTVFAIEEHGNQVYAGGEFTMAAGVAAARIARWDGSQWSPMGSGIAKANGGYVAVYAIRSWTPPSGPPLVVVTGDFDRAGGLVANGIAAWNGTSWQTLGIGIYGIGAALEVFDDGTGPALYVGGAIFGAGGVIADNIVRWDGTSWSTVGLGSNAAVLALEVHDDGGGPVLAVGGTFTSVGLQLASRLAFWDGAKWESPATYIASSDGPTAVFALTSFDDGHVRRLAIGGQFTSVNGLSARRLVHWSAGQFQTAPNLLGPSTDGAQATIYALETWDRPTGNEFFVGGFFASENPNRQQYLAAFRPDDDSPACVRLDACADGNVGMGSGGPFDVLRVNGHNGGRSHRVGVAPLEAIAIDLLTPPTSALPAAFTLFAYLDAPTPANVTILPFNLGDMCFAPCVPGIADAFSLTIADAFGFGPLVCAPFAPATPTPWTLSHPGLPVTARIAMQGLIQDPSQPTGLAVTNAVLLVIGN